jgi:hypothetical protein
MGAERAVVVRPGEGRRVGNVEFLARSQDTPRFNIAVITIQPHSEGPGLHAHAEEDDAFYMLEGELRFTVDGEDVAAGPARSSSSRRRSRIRSRTAATQRPGSSTSTRRPASIFASKRTRRTPRACRVVRSRAAQAPRRNRGRTSRRRALKRNPCKAARRRPALWAVNAVPVWSRGKGKPDALRSPDAGPPTPRKTPLKVGRCPQRVRRRTRSIPRRHSQHKRHT